MWCDILSKSFVCWLLQSLKLKQELEFVVLSDWSRFVQARVITPFLLLLLLLKATQGPVRGRQRRVVAPDPTDEVRGVVAGALETSSSVRAALAPPIFS